MGFNAPSKIQETALPALLADPSVIVSLYLSFNSEPCMLFTVLSADDAATVGWATVSTKSIQTVKSSLQISQSFPRSHLTYGDYENRSVKHMPRLCVCVLLVVVYTVYFVLLCYLCRRGFCFHLHLFVS